jgi:hypothetical protein
MFFDVLSSLSLPMVRGTLAQKVLDAPMERDTGARRAKELRRMEGIMCDVLVVCCCSRRKRACECVGQDQATRKEPR